MNICTPSISRTLAIVIGDVKASSRCRARFIALAEQAVSYRDLHDQALAEGLYQGPECAQEAADAMGLTFPFQHSSDTSAQP
ncbi:hypothetical protein FB106_1207 [Synechococcus sp. Ace-Pa]|uniref:hypothetical protein n=1 Tax=Synechococcus sp. Ace-Pa TaxID=2572902 RepID=UPI00119F2F7D|nr:hypothetical protein [Synechococcus sp. Ace-Pa]MCT4364770.1 hypothetical protein [Candidatus Regnicoccus frigidus MAG-AL1]TWB87672.1 hypothetical protein FB106_1207 [Synechococcus sp. Ace-Pa]